MTIGLRSTGENARISLVPVFDDELEDALANCSLQWEELLLKLTETLAATGHGDLVPYATPGGDIVLFKRGTETPALTLPYDPPKIEKKALTLVTKKSAGKGRKDKKKTSGKGKNGVKKTLPKTAHEMATRSRA